LIEAKHSWWARTIFTRYIDKLLKKHFTNFYLANNLPEIPNEFSVIVTPNHISWWDGFLIDIVNRNCIKKTFHIMMLEEQLERYWFFNHLGAYSIHPENSKSIIETAKYTRRILESSQSLVTIYPQGKIESFDSYKLDIKEGLKVFIGKSLQKVKVLPIGFKIHYYEEKLPAIVTRFGELIDAQNVVEDFEYYRQIFIKNINQLSTHALKKEFQSDIFKN